MVSFGGGIQNSMLKWELNKEKFSRTQFSSSSNL